jgi:hypothetical protein
MATPNCREVPERHDTYTESSAPPRCKRSEWPSFLVWLTVPAHLRRRASTQPAVNDAEPPSRGDAKTLHPFTADCTSKSSRGAVRCGRVLYIQRDRGFMDSNVGNALVERLVTRLFSLSSRRSGSTAKAHSLEKRLPVTDTFRNATRAAGDKATAGTSQSWAARVQTLTRLDPYGRWPSGSRVEHEDDASCEAVRDPVTSRAWHSPEPL